MQVVDIRTGTWWLPAFCLEFDGSINTNDLLQMLEATVKITALPDEWGTRMWAGHAALMQEAFSVK